MGYGALGLISRWTPENIDKSCQHGPKLAPFWTQVGPKIDAQWVPRCTYQAIAILLYCYIAILLYWILLYCYIAILLYFYLAGGPFCMVNNGVRSTWVDFRRDSLDPPGPPKLGAKMDQKSSKNRSQSQRFLQSIFWSILNTSWTNFWSILDAIWGGRRTISYCK